MPEKFPGQLVPTPMPENGTKNCPKKTCKIPEADIHRARQGAHQLSRFTEPRWKLVRASPSAVIRVLLGGMKGRVGGMAVGIN